MTRNELALLPIVLKSEPSAAGVHVDGVIGAVANFTPGPRPGSVPRKRSKEQDDGEEEKSSETDDGESEDEGPKRRRLPREIGTSGLNEVGGHVLEKATKHSGPWHNSDGLSSDATVPQLRQHLWGDHQFEWKLPDDRDDLDQIHKRDHDENGECGAHEKGEVQKARVTVAGLCMKSTETGRVLMIKRSHQDLDDPARGTFEFPGGKLEPGESPEVGAEREFSEEVGVGLPPGRIVDSWTRGIYQCFIYLTPSEMIDPEDWVSFTNPDDPDGDMCELVAWFDPHQARNFTNLRSELVGDDEVWDLIESAGEVKPQLQLLPIVLKQGGEWDPTKHPRGQPENKGEFGPGGGSTTSLTKPVQTPLTQPVPGHPQLVASPPPPPPPPTPLTQPVNQPSSSTSESPSTEPVGLGTGEKEEGEEKEEPEKAIVPRLSADETKVATEAASRLESAMNGAPHKAEVKASVVKSITDRMMKGHSSGGFDTAFQALVGIQPFNSSVDPSVYATSAVLDAHHVVSQSPEGSVNVSGLQGYRPGSDEEAKKLFEKQGYLTWAQDNNMKAAPGADSLIHARGDTPQALDMVRRAGVSRLLHQWANTSNDEYSLSFALQRSAVKEFKLKDTSPWTEGEPSGTDSDEQTYGPVMRAFLRAQYQETQDYLKKNDIKSLTLYRGVKGSPELNDAVDNGDGTTTIRLRPLSSWSVDQNTAAGSFGVGGTVLTAVCPAKKILSTALTGNGCVNEGEVTVLGGQAHAAIVGGQWGESGPTQEQIINDWAGNDEQKEWAQSEVDGMDADQTMTSDDLDSGWSEYVDYASGEVADEWQNNHPEINGEKADSFIEGFNENQDYSHIPTVDELNDAWKSDVDAQNDEALDTFIASQPYPHLGLTDFVTDWLTDQGFDNAKYKGTVQGWNGMAGNGQQIDVGKLEKDWRDHLEGKEPRPDMTPGPGQLQFGEEFMPHKPKLGLVRAQGSGPPRPGYIQVKGPGDPGYDEELGPGYIKEPPEGYEFDDPKNPGQYVLKKVLIPIRLPVYA